MTCSDLLRARGHSGRAPRSRVKAARTKVKGHGGPECLRVCNKCLFRNFFFFNRNTSFFLIPAHSTSDLFPSGRVTTPATGSKGPPGSYLANWRGKEAEGALIPAFSGGAAIIAVEPRSLQPSTANTKQSSSNIRCLSFPTVTLPRSADLNSFRDFDCNFK